MKSICTLLIVLSTSICLSQEPESLQPESLPSKLESQKPEWLSTVEFLPTESDVVGWAFDALMKYDEADWPYIRFIYLPPWADPEWIGVVDLAMNSACSQTPILVRGDRHAGGWLLGYNMQRLAPDPAQLRYLMEVYDSLAIKESKLHVPAINTVEVVETVQIPTNEQRRGGPTTRKVTRKVEQRVALLAPHLVDQLAKHTGDINKSERVDVLLTQMTNSTGAIYPADFVIEQLLTSARGKYPEFRQMDLKSENGLQELFSRRGFNFKQAQNFYGDKGAFIIASDVTGKNRLVFTTYGVGSRQPLAVTFDFKDNRTRPDRQFVRNLVQFEPLTDAAEALIPMSNGLIEYVLSDAQGRLQRVAPPDVVADHTKPDGFTAELEMGMSCIICHGPNSGYRTAKNDMEFMLGADADIAQELTYTNADGKEVFLTKAEVVSILASRFADRIDEPDGILGRARRDYIQSVTRITDYPVTDGENAAQLVAAKLKTIYHDYRYKLINAQRACLELGVRVPEEHSMKMLRMLVPPPPVGSEEDIVIAMLRNGASIKRDDMDAIYVEMARRAMVARSTMTGDFTAQERKVDE